MQPYHRVLLRQKLGQYDNLADDSSTKRCQIIADTVLIEFILFFSNCSYVVLVLLQCPWLDIGNRGICFILTC